VLDGEVSIYDEKLRSRFDWLREPDADAVATPPMFMVFDLLHEDGRELTGRPLRDRRARLKNVVAGSEFVLPVRRLAKNGFEAWAEVVAHDYEGLVAKEEASLYEVGPTRRWLKVKQRGLEVVVKWLFGTLSKGRQASRVGELDRAPNHIPSVVRRSALPTLS
jgi:bifunctional non-homologous end joining protein LigD